MASTEFMEQIRSVAARIPAQAESIPTVEATKSALVLPFLKALGYDVFDPAEVLPAPGGGVDYAILRDGRPLFLVECRRLGTDLGGFAATGLALALSHSEARFGIITDGRIYLFFASTAPPDGKPFFRFDLQAFAPEEAGELSRISKTAFRIETILAEDRDARVQAALRTTLSSLVQAPTPGFLSFLAEAAGVGPEAAMDPEWFAGLAQREIRALATPCAQKPEALSRELAPLAEPTPASPIVAWPQHAATPSIPLSEPVADALDEPEPEPRNGFGLGLFVGLLILAGLGSGYWYLTHRHRPAPPLPPPAAPQAAPAPAPPPQPEAPAAPAPPESPAAAAPAPDPGAAFLAQIARDDLSGATELGAQRVAAAASGHWTLRLGVASGAATVRNYAAQLKGREADLFIRPFRMKDGRKCYQVFLGDQPSEAAARGLLQGLPQAFLKGNAPKPFEIGKIPDHQ